MKMKIRKHSSNNQSKRYHSITIINRKLSTTAILVARDAYFLEQKKDTSADNSKNINYKTIITNPKGQYENKSSLISAKSQIIDRERGATART